MVENSDQDTNSKYTNMYNDMVKQYFELKYEDD